MTPTRPYWQRPLPPYPHQHLLDQVRLRLTGPKGHNETPASILTNQLVRPPYNPNWPLEANCRDQPTELFYPGPGNPDPNTYAICHNCPVRIDCLTEAILTNETIGIWGGLGRRARIDMRKRIW